MTIPYLIEYLPLAREALDSGYKHQEILKDLGFLLQRPQAALQQILTTLEEEQEVPEKAQLLMSLVEEAEDILSVAQKQIEFSPCDHYLQVSNVSFKYGYPIIQAYCEMCQSSLVIGDRLKVVNIFENLVGNTGLGEMLERGEQVDPREIEDLAKSYMSAMNDNGMWAEPMPSILQQILQEHQEDQPEQDIETLEG